MGLQMRQIAGTAAAVAVFVAGCSAAGSTTPVQQPAASTQAAVGAASHGGHNGYSSPPASAPLRAGEWFSQLSMPRPYTPAAPNGGTDDYRCFLLDPKLTGKAFLTGSDFLPRNANLVHHAIFFRIDPADVPQARQLDAQAPGLGWTCFGGSGVGGSAPGAQLDGGGASWIGAWAPGAGEALLPSGTGYPMQAGSEIVMQVHYNLLAAGARGPGPDQSAIRLRLMDGRAALRPLQTALLPAPVELPCAAGESGPLCNRDLAVLDVMRRFGGGAGATVAGLNLLCDGGRPPVPGPVQSCDRTIRQAGIVYALAGHMHLLGRSIKIELNPGTPQARVLLDVGVYNFHDQRPHALPRPVAVKAGDTYRVTCTHDARIRQENPQLRQLPPRYVVWGDGTSDEMCLGIVIWTPRG